MMRDCLGEPDLLAQVPAFADRLNWFLNYRPDLAALVSELPGHFGRSGVRFLGVDIRDSPANAQAFGYPSGASESWRQFS